MRERWSIEVMFRDLKQNLLLGNHPFRGETGAHLGVCIPLILYDELSEQAEAAEEPNCTLGFILKKLRLEMTHHTEKLLLEGKHLKQKYNGYVLKDLIESRRILNCIKKKVVNTASDKKSPKTLNSA